MSEQDFGKGLENAWHGHGFDPEGGSDFKDADVDVLEGEGDTRAVSLNEHDRITTQVKDVIGGVAGTSGIE